MYRFFFFFSLSIVKGIHFTIRFNFVVKRINHIDVLLLQFASIRYHRILKVKKRKKTNCHSLRQTITKKKNFREFEIEHENIGKLEWNVCVANAESKRDLYVAGVPMPIDNQVKSLSIVVHEACQRFFSVFYLPLSPSPLSSHSVYT